MERENKSLVRDVDRLKQSLEEKDIALEEVNIQKATLEREKNKLARDLETLNSDQSKNFELVNLFISFFAHFLHSELRIHVHQTPGCICFSCIGQFYKIVLTILVGCISL